MKRAMLGLLVLAVCGMMMGPMVMADKPSGGGGGKYSTITTLGDATNGFEAGSTQGSWFSGSRWDVHPTTSSNDPIGPGGTVTINEPVNLFSDPISMSTHGEMFYIYDIAKKSQISPNKLDQKTYNLPDQKIAVRFWILIEGITNPDKGEPGQHDTIQLTISLDTNKLPVGQQVALTIGAKQVTLSGTDIHFHYDDMHQEIDWDVPLYGSAAHSFQLMIDR